jgi:LTXXQ motif family protein
MYRQIWLSLMALGLLMASGGADSYAQFGGRGGIGGIFGGPARGGRGERGAQKDSTRVDRPIPPAIDSYEQTEHRLMLMQVDLHLTPDQQQPWQGFAEKVLVYARDLSHERAAAGMPVSAGTSVDGLQHIAETTDLARQRLSELEDIRAAANSLYKSLSPDQKQIADTRIMTIIAPHPTSPPGGADGNKSTDAGSDSTRLHQ